MRILICGGPGTGKSTLAKLLGDDLGIDVFPTDIYAALPWDEQKKETYIAVKDVPRLIVEGVTSVRILKLGYKPDHVIWCAGEHRAGGAGMAAMTKKQLADYGGPVLQYNKDDYDEIKLLLLKHR